MGKVNKTALAATLAVIYGFIIFAICLISATSGWAKEVTTIYSSFFPGVSATIMGSVIGAVYGVIFGAIFGYAIGVLYNYFDERIKIKK
jgi:hypothetical protein